MSQRLTINQNNKPIYDIVFEQDFAALPSELEQFQIADKKLCIITDSKVNHLYSEEVCDVLKDKCKEVVVFSFPDGEKSKNLDTVKDIYEFLIQHKFDRKDAFCIRRRSRGRYYRICSCNLSERYRLCTDPYHITCAGRQQRRRQNRR